MKGTKRSDTPMKGGMGGKKPDMPMHPMPGGEMMPGKKHMPSMPPKGMPMKKGKK